MTFWLQHQKTFNDLWFNLWNLLITLFDTSLFDTIKVMVAFNLTSTLHTCALFKNVQKYLKNVNFLYSTNDPGDSKLFFTFLWINPLRVKVTVKLNKFLNFEHSLGYIFFFDFISIHYFRCRCIQTFLRLACF